MAVWLSKKLSCARQRFYVSTSIGNVIHKICKYWCKNLSVSIKSYERLNYMTKTANIKLVGTRSITAWSTWYSASNDAEQLREYFMQSVRDNFLPASILLFQKRFQRTGRSVFILQCSHNKREESVFQRIRTSVLFQPLGYSGSAVPLYIRYAVIFWMLTDLIQSNLDVQCNRFYH